PLMIGSDAPGKELLHPVAIVIFGGLVTSTLLDTILTPILFLRYGGKPLERLAAVQAEFKLSEAYLHPPKTQPKRNNMLRALMLVLSLALMGPAFAHSDSKWTKGPQGGHLVDAGGGKQHWELVASGNELTLYVLDANEKPMADASAGSVKGLVLLGGKT